MKGMSLPREALEQMADWLENVVRLGLGNEEVSRPTFWHEQAARLTDAKLPGLARRLRRICIWPTNSMSWAPVIAIELGRLHLLAQAALQYADLPAEMQQELALTLRPAPRRDALIARTIPVTDQWMILGRRVSMEPLAPHQRMRVAETWLIGRETGRIGVHAGFSPERSSRVKTEDAEPMSPPVQPLGELLETTPEGTAGHFISGICPQRLLFPGNPAFSPSGEPFALPWMGNLAEVRKSLLTRLDQLPWLEQHPFLLKGVMPLTEDQARDAGSLRLDTPFPSPRWVADAEGSCAPVSPLLPEAAWWRWLALAHEQGPTRVFGLLDPAPYVLPYGVWAEGEPRPRGMV